MRTTETNVACGKAKCAKKKTQEKRKTQGLQELRRNALAEPAGEEEGPHGPATPQGP